MEFQTMTSSSKSLEISYQLLNSLNYHNGKRSKLKQLASTEFATLGSCLIQKELPQAEPVRTRKQTPCNYYGTIFKDFLLPDSCWFRGCGADNIAYLPISASIPDGVLRLLPCSTSRILLHQGILATGACLDE